MVKVGNILFKLGLFLLKHFVAVNDCDVFFQIVACDMNGVQVSHMHLKKYDFGQTLAKVYQKTSQSNRLIVVHEEQILQTLENGGSTLSHAPQVVLYKVCSCLVPEPPKPCYSFHQQAQIESEINKRCSHCQSSIIFSILVSFARDRFHTKN